MRIGEARVHPAHRGQRRSDEGTAPLIVDRLAMLHDAGRRRRWCVQGVPFALGSAVGLIGTALFVFELVRALTFAKHSNAFFYALIGMHLGPFFSALALRPQDGTPLRALVAILASIYFTGGGVASIFVIDALRVAGNPADGSDVALQLMASRQVMGAVGGVSACASNVVTLYADVRLGAPLRTTHRRMFQTAGYLNGLLTIAYGFYALIAAAFPRPSLVERRHLPATIVLTTTTACISALCLWPPLQVRVHAWLAQVGESVNVAAGISELLSGRTPEEVVAAAREGFRAVPLDRLRRDDLEPVAVQAQLAPSAGRTVTPADAASNSTRARPDLEAGSPARRAKRASAMSAESLDSRFGDACVRASLGTVDAFVSHSWQDDPELKWEALQAWRREFVAAHKREPTIWFDRLCIVQDAELIAQQLASLPVYLAGCRTLLVLRGSTYTSRLWCVLELFIFSEMGAGVDQIRVVRLADAPDVVPDRSHGRRRGFGASHISELVLSRFSGAPPAGFDVRNATTTDPRDQHALLAVIENAGAGVDAFNAWARAMLARDHFNGNV